MTAELTNNHIALMLLDAIEGLGIRRKTRIIEGLSAPSELLEDEANVREVFERIAGAEHYATFRTAVKNNLQAELIERLDKAGVSPIIYLDDTYPEPLLNIYDRPLLLYAKGRTELLNSRCISVVGTRSPSRYGINVTRDFVTAFAQAGLTTVSGFAKGIDGTAHRTAVELDCPTIAVFANGVDQIYPAENRALYARILETGGLIISEYKTGTRPTTYNFPERNRIISGISDGLFVPEAGERSGTLITVNLAIEQGKRIYVVPGNVNSPQSRGSNRLLKDTEGGCVVLEPSDVLQDYGIVSDKPQKQAYQLSFVERQILDALSIEETHVEELIELTQLSFNELNSVLLNLEIYDLIEKTSGNNYILK